MSGILFGIGNPLLDILAKVAPGYVQRWNLDSNAQINAQEDHLGPVSKNDYIKILYSRQRLHILVFILY